MNSRTKTLLSNSFYFAVAGLGGKLMVFLMVPVYTYVLRPEEFGIVSIVQTTNGFLYPILTLYISNAVLRFSFIKTNKLEDVFSIGIRTCLLGSIINIPVVWILSFFPLFSNITEYMFLMPILLFGNIFNNLFNSFARCINKVKYSALCGLLNTFTLVIFSILLIVIFKMGVIGYLLAFIISDMLSILYIVKSCHLNKYVTFNYNKPLAREMYLYSFPLVPNRLSWWLFVNFNQYVILYYLSEEYVGYFSASMRIPTILTVLAGIFSQAWMLSALDGYGTQDNALFIRNVHTKYFSLITLAVSVLIILTYPLSTLLLKGNFGSYWYIIPFLFIAVYLGSLVGIYETIFLAEKKNVMLLISTLWGAIASTLFTILLIRYYGLIVVSISMMLGYVIICIILKIKLNDYIDIGLPHHVFLVHLLLLIIEAILVMKECILLATFIPLLFIRQNRKTLYMIYIQTLDSIYNYIYKKNEK